MQVPYAEFYITNVCNLNCTNCNRFNNFNFSGHSYWKDHKDTYKKWSEILQIDKIGILGGEPLLNPDFMSWLEGIADLWPTSKINIITNGSQLHRHPTLYNYVAKNSQRIKFILSFHGFNQRLKVVDILENWLQKPFTQTVIHDSGSNQIWQQGWDKIKDPSWPPCRDPRDFVELPDHIQKECRDVHGISLDIWEKEVCSTVFCDANQVTVGTSLGNSFNNSSIIFDPISKKLFLNNSDPKKALEVCYSKTCHHFIRGKLYKCGPVGILPEFIQQFDVEMSKSDRDLINGYVPASVDWTPEDLQKFVDDLNDQKSIPQCKFCPESMVPLKFEADAKKTKLLKIQPLAHSTSP